MLSCLARTLQALFNLSFFNNIYTYIYTHIDQPSLSTISVSEFLEPNKWFYILLYWMISLTLPYLTIFKILKPWNPIPHPHPSSKILENAMYFSLAMMDNKMTFSQSFCPSSLFFRNKFREAISFTEICCFLGDYTVKNFRCYCFQWNQSCSLPATNLPLQVLWCVTKKSFISCVGRKVRRNGELAVGGGD